VNSDGARVFIKRTFGASCAYLCVGVRMDMRSESSGVDVRLQPPLACFLSPPRIHTFFFSPALAFCAPALCDDCFYAFVTEIEKKKELLLKINKKESTKPTSEKNEEIINVNGEGRPYID
jgi:hypothetical protein